MLKLFRFTGRVLLFGVLIFSIVVIAAGVVFHASLAELDGRRRVVGLSGEVEIGRDAGGQVLIRGETEEDVALALGFVHAQERFFQMDLARRRPAGRMAEIFGERALGWDRRIRAHRLDQHASEVLRRFPVDQRRIIKAYCRGVNEGLSALPGVPFEYLLLRQKPEKWSEKDSVLVIYSMFLELNPWEDTRELAISALKRGLPEGLFAFLVTEGCELDAPMRGTAFLTPDIPGPEVLDLGKSIGRGMKENTETGEGIGSNAWAVSGSRTRDGRAILACDMHLPLMVPNTWFRAELLWKDSADDQGVHVTGVSLPGVPGIIAGSNTHVSWGFTNSYGDWVDLVAVDPVGVASYHTRQELKEFENFTEMIRVRGKDPVRADYQATIWGPLVAEGPDGRPLALRWTAERPGGVNFSLLDMQKARTIEEALSIGASCGMPPQNLVVASETGRIGWSIAGRIPVRRGCGDALPQGIVESDCEWSGWLSAKEYPRIVDPPSGLIWTANARVVDGAWLELLGDGGYNLGARAGQIRDDLFELEEATESDMLNIQLDDRAIFLEWWRELLLDTLSKSGVESSPERAELERVARNSTGRAAVDDVGYRMVRAFRIYVRSLVLDPLVRGACDQFDGPCGWEYLGQREGPLRKLLAERPPHLLDPKFSTWDDLLLDAADRVIREFTSRGTRLADHPWGQRNTLHMNHPLSAALPDFLKPLLNMPTEPLPGDTHMPRVQSPTFGASERLVVSPGHENEGILETPGGQSGHFLSPYYRKGHSGWVEGTPDSLLTGPIEHQLLLFSGENGRLRP